MLFEWLLEKFGYRKVIKAPTYSQYVNKKLERVEYLRNMAKPLIQSGVRDFISNGEYISNLIKYLYSNFTMKVNFSFNNWNSLESKGYEYEFNYDVLQFTFHKKYKVNDIDYKSIFIEELKNGLKQYELTIIHNEQYGNFYIIPENKKTLEDAEYCNKIMVVS